jgi:hypothetical protein
MKRSFLLFLCLYFVTMSCTKNPPLPTIDEVKILILRDIKENIRKYIKTDNYDNFEIVVANIKQSKDYDSNTRRVSYKYTASFTVYKGQQLHMTQTIFNIIPLEHISEIGWRKREIKTVL